MQVIDVTLRESVYYESGMTYADRLQYLRDLCQFISNELLQYVEISFIDNDVEMDLNYDETFIRDAYEICKGTFKLVAMLHPGKADWTKWDPDVIRMFDMVRIMVPLDKMADTVEYIDYFHKLGVKVACNLLYAASAPMETIRKMEREGAAMGVDYFYCADSSGSFTPVFTSELSKMLVDNKGDFEIGFHLHDHMRMALANALIAKENGVEMIDVSIIGAGKGGGNMKMEETLLLLCGKEKIDLTLLNGLYQMIVRFCHLVSKNPTEDVNAFINYLTGIYKLNLKDIARLEQKADGHAEAYFKALLGAD